MIPRQVAVGPAVIDEVEAGTPAAQAGLQSGDTILELNDERIKNVQEAGRLIRLTTNLLYLASADAGREPERRPVELDVLFLEVYRQTKDLRPDVRLSLGNEDQVTVVGDRDLLKQMLLNLAENAVKYSPPSGQVTLSLFKSDGQARVVVEDTGPGIAPEHLPHIFERFYRGDDRTKMGGSGLGLAIARWVATAHGGEIDVKSTVGRGSTFSVVLPFVDTTGPNPAVKPQPESFNGEGDAGP